MDKPKKINDLVGLYNKPNEKDGVKSNATRTQVIMKKNNKELII